MKQESFVSAAQAHRTAVQKFAAGHAQTCECATLQLREESGALRCARCDAPVVRRSRPVVRDMKSERIGLVLRELRALLRTTTDFETEKVIAGTIASVVGLERHLRRKALAGRAQ